jgi:RNA polymerase sigma-70 factor (ECF subfamily)
VSTPDRDWLAQRFEQHRAHLRAVSYRMLGSAAEADDAVQEAWLRLSRADAAGIENLGGWLTTVVARVCLSLLQARKVRHEEPLDIDVSEPVVSYDQALDPEGQVVLADSVGLALLVVLDTLGPAERLAFVLHDMFAVPFEEIAPIVGRSPAAARQLASRARRRVRTASPNPDTDPNRQRDVVTAFLAAARRGDFSGLVELLDPEVVVRSDEAARQLGATPGVLGGPEVARAFLRYAGGARLALIAGLMGAAWAPGGRPRGVLRFTIGDGRISMIDLLADPARIGALDIVFVES